MSRRHPGSLEAEVLGALARAGGPLSPGELRDQLASGDLAYTTITTVLGRLVAKGLVRRQRDGRRYSYEPAVDESALVAERMHADLRLAADRGVVLQRFVSALSDAEAAALRTTLRRRGRG